MQQIKELLTQSNSFYLYDLGVIQTNVDTLHKAFPGVGILYSLKTNPHPAVVQTIVQAGCGADAASLGEVRLAQKLGLPPSEIQYSAPGKTIWDIEEALPVATLIADSVGEVARIAQVAQKQGVVANIGLRINPNFSLEGDRGVASKFGIDQDQVLAHLDQWTAWDKVNIVGIHVHLRSQELRGPLLAAYYEKMLHLVSTITQGLGHGLSFVNLGSGLGVAYGGADQPLDLDALGIALAQVRAKAQYPDLQFYMESGRFIAAKSGIYVSKVLDIKESHGTKFAVLANTLNGFVRPSLAQMVVAYAGEDAPPCEPLFTHSHAFPLTTTAQGDTLETVTLVGNLCTSADVVAKDVVLPQLQEGDGVVFPNAGAYAAVLSPMQFSAQTPPAVYIRGVDGSLSNKD